MRKEDPKFIEKRKKFYAEQKEKSQDKYSKGGLSPKQKVIAAKAPPPNKITGEDFDVMKKEKVMKARTGSIIRPQGPGVLRPKPTVGGKPLKPKPIKPNKKMGGGMMKKPMGYVGGGPAEESDLAKRSFGKQRVRNARGRSATRPRGPAGRAASGPRKMDDILKETKKFTDSNSGLIIVTKDDIFEKMGGGMMKKPMGYKSGKSIKVKCKLGKNKPTKMY